MQQGKQMGCKSVAFGLVSSSLSGPTTYLSSEKAIAEERYLEET